MWQVVDKVPHGRRAKEGGTAAAPAARLAARAAHGHRRRVFSMLDSQSRPSNRPSPLIADVLKIAQSRLLMLDSPRPSATAASSSAPGRSCQGLHTGQQLQETEYTRMTRLSALGGAAPVCWRTRG